MTTDVDQFRRSISAATFFRRTKDALEKLSPVDSREPRKGSPAKLLLEEVLPLALLARKFESRRIEVRCRLVGVDGGSADGLLELSGAEVERGFLLARYPVQITMALPRNSHLYREALNLGHGVFINPEICAEGGPRGSPARKIVSSAVARDPEEVQAEGLKSIRDAVHAKLDSRYSRPGILLVCAELHFTPTLEFWAQVRTHIADMDVCGHFDGAFVVERNSGEVHCLIWCGSGC